MKSVNAAQRVELARQRFYEAATELEPLGIVKRNPVKSLSAAFLLGICLTGLQNKHKLVSMAPVALQLATIMAKYLVSNK